MSGIINFKDLNVAQKKYYIKEVGSYYMGAEGIKFVETKYNLFSFMKQNSICAEIGVRMGATSKYIYKELQPSKFHLIDCWDLINQASYGEFSKNVLKYGNLDEAYERFPTPDRFRKLSTYYTRRYAREIVQDMFQKEIESGRAEIHHGYSKEVGASFPDKYFDWIFIDGDHAGEAVKQDLETYSSKVKNGGYILGHDYERRRFSGLIESVNEFCKKHKWRISFLTISSDSLCGNLNKRAEVVNSYLLEKN